MIRNSEIVEEVNEGNLFLRKISKEDIEFVFQSLNNKDLITYLSLGPIKTLEHTKRLIKGYLKYWDKNLQFNYIIELQDDNKIKIGSISLWNISWQHHRAQIGIWLIPSFWSKGLAEKSLSLIKIIAFNHLKINRLEAYIAIDNKRSIALFEKSGFRKEGILKEYLNFQGSYHDAIIMACLKK
jgi:ribosomal-protein-alanine N-acetyltransferase